MINNINLKNFRSYEDSSFEFEPGVNIIVGPNASGKTNIIESILIATSGSSYRGRDINLVMHTKEWSRIDMSATKTERVVKFQKDGEKIDRSLEIDEQKRKRMPKDKVIKSVLFEPNHLLMFHGGPELRREFIDDLLSSISDEFLALRRDYKRALLQRNTLLRSDRIDKNSVFIWNLRLSDLGGSMASHRNTLLAEMREVIPEIYKDLSSSGAEVTIDYVSKCRVGSYANDMLKLLELNIEKDIARKHTTIGPHRDDIDVYINGHNIKESASRGEVRTIILAFKIFEQQQKEKRFSYKPIILLDDVFSELDGSRRKSLTNYLKDSQVFITTTDADVVIQHFLDDCNIIPLD